MAPSVHAYNSTKHDSMVCSPFFLKFGRHLRLAVDVPYQADAHPIELLRPANNGNGKVGELS